MTPERNIREKIEIRMNILILNPLSSFSILSRAACFIFPRNPRIIKGLKGGSSIFFSPFGFSGLSRGLFLEIQC